MDTAIASSKAFRTLSLPVQAKVGDGWTWPEAARFYLLTRNGPFICRRTPFFQSSVPARRFYLELAGHETSLQLHYPPIPQELFETIVGFFDRIARVHHAEAVVLLTYRAGEGYHALAPPQRSLVHAVPAGDPRPVCVRYDIPPPAPDTQLVGSLHSHPDRLGAFSSPMDEDDARHHFPGLHFVIGKLDREPPTLHCLFAVDGTVADVADPYHLVEGYAQRRDTFPADWLEQVTVEELPPGRNGRPRPWRSSRARPDGMEPGDRESWYGETWYGE